MIHIRVNSRDENQTNDEAQFYCGIVGVKNLPAGDVYFFETETLADRADCSGCNPGGPRPLGTPISKLSTTPGKPGYEEWCRIARSWEYD